jgi:integral membrane protein (TIGR00529 family)
LTALLKIALVFAGIVVLLSRKWNLGLVLLLACVAVGLLFTYPLQYVALDLLLAAVDPLTLRLALIVVMIMILSELLRQTAGLKGTVTSLQALIPNGRIVIAALPALVGLLPMVGGAMFSAPMVDKVGDRLNASRGRKTFVNYWFRHVWEPVFPLYPSALLAAELLNKTNLQLAAASWPLAATAAVGGLLFGLLKLPRRGDDDPSASASRAQNLRTLARSIWPIVLVISLPLILRIDERIDLILSLVLTIAVMMTVKRVPLVGLGIILRRHIPWNTVVVIFSALMFRRVLDQSGAVGFVSAGLTELNLPVGLVAFAIPFIASLLTGLVVAGYSIGFPVVLPLIVASGEAVPPAWAAWLMAGGFMGVMCSPLHLCLALTRVYFKTDWTCIYRFILPSAGLVVATVAGILLFS